MHKYMACRAQTAYFRNVEKGSCLRDINLVRFLRQERIFSEIFMNISHIVGFSRLTSCIFFTYIHTNENPIPRDLKLKSSENCLNSTVALKKVLALLSY